MSHPGGVIMRTNHSEKEEHVTRWNLTLKSSTLWTKTVNKLSIETHGDASESQKIELSPGVMPSEEQETSWVVFTSMPFDWMGLIFV
mmetsp:Transcript_1657/g.4028  ORF Transcript_1657/g.4028 Transcript_1657/m.4028 type:complete len:87 (-) Transcript_1657:190-450(-)